MPRVQLAPRVADLEGSVAFYSKLFGTEPAKRRPGYANFAIAEPPLKLVLIEGQAGEDTRLDHLWVEVESTEQVTAATVRLREAGLATFEENDMAGDMGRASVGARQGGRGCCRGGRFGAGTLVSPMTSIGCRLTVRLAPFPSWPGGREPPGGRRWVVGGGGRRPGVGVPGAERRGRISTT
ncbi:ArsI/CadI family heavy metal resistance metalloenzyme [Kitasatospora aureofaciens]|uniref:ArsI/CadI family heavy metal resistance metalloenzyme n=1 Tax=Kitasatospora aureofaciens TaxID=1894 RepID=UPI0033E7472B